MAAIPEQNALQIQQSRQAWRERAACLAGASCRWAPRKQHRQQRIFCAATTAHTGASLPMPRLPACRPAGHTCSTTTPGRAAMQYIRRRPRRRPSFIVRRNPRPMLDAMLVSAKMRVASRVSRIVCRQCGRAGHVAREGVLAMRARQAVSACPSGASGASRHTPHTDAAAARAGAAGVAAGPPSRATTKAHVESEQDGCHKGIAKRVECRKRGSHDPGPAGGRKKEEQLKVQCCNFCCILRRCGFKGLAPAGSGAGGRGKRRMSCASPPPHPPTQPSHTPTQPTCGA